MYCHCSYVKSSCCDIFKMSKWYATTIQLASCGGPSAGDLAVCLSHPSRNNWYNTAMQLILFDATKTRQNPNETHHVVQLMLMSWVCPNTCQQAIITISEQLVCPNQTQLMKTSPVRCPTAQPPSRWCSSDPRRGAGTGYGVRV